MSRQKFLDDEKIPKNTTNKFYFHPHSLVEKNYSTEPRGEKDYVIILFGVKDDGSRLSVVLKDIKPYFLVAVPDGVEPEEYAKTIKEYVGNVQKEKYKNSRAFRDGDFVYDDLDLNPISTEILQKKKLIGFQNYKHRPLHNFIKLSYSKAYNRKCAMTYLIREKGCETAVDDTSSYFRVVCRDYLISFNKWAELEGIIRKDSRFRDDVVEISINDYKVSEKQDIKKKFLICAWDIETYCVRNVVPQPEHEDASIFMIGMSFQWLGDKNPIYQVCICDHECVPDPNIKYIKAPGEKGILKVFGQILGEMRPDIMVAFNDGNYDWPWVFERAKKHKVLKSIYDGFCAYKPFGNSKPMESELERHYRIQANVKYEAGKEMRLDFYQPPGNVNIDLLFLFRKTYPKSVNYKLNTFLEILGLQLKDDMPINKMKAYYAAALNESPGWLEKYTEIAKYCVVDCQRCNDIMENKLYLMSFQAEGDVSYITLDDAIYRGIGVKVKNIVFAEGQKQNYAITTTRSSEVSEFKYPGAFVVEPKVGVVKPKNSIDERVAVDPDWSGIPEKDLDSLKDAIFKDGFECKHPLRENPKVRAFLEEENNLPITSLDFASLYPSIIMTYNLSPDRMIPFGKAKYALELVQKYKTKLHTIRFRFGNQDRVAYSVAHEGHTELDDPEYNFGLFGYILNNLKKDRKNITRNIMKPIAEEIEKIHAKYGKDIPPEEEKNLNKLNYEYRNLDALQKAKKVLMNSFYGESGSKNSPFYMVDLSGGVTSFGKVSLQNIIEYLTEKDCKIYYGDTDSCYFTLPQTYYTDLIRSYYGGRIKKIDYAGNCVKKTMDAMAEIQKDVNVYLRGKTGYSFLEMEYEEVLYPAIFFARKMYAGIPHVKEVNFNAKLFIRGLAFAKRNSTKFNAKISKEILKEILDVESAKNPRDIIEEKIKYIYSLDFNNIIDELCMSKEYKPNKKNVALKMAVENMERKFGVIILDSEKHEFVYMDSSYLEPNDKLCVGNLLVLRDVAVERNILVNKEQYFDSEIDGQLSIFTSFMFDKTVAFPTKEAMSKMTESEQTEMYKARGKKVRDNARKSIKKFRKEYYSNKSPYKVMIDNYKNITDLLKKIYEKDLVTYLFNNMASADFALNYHQSVKESFPEEKVPEIFKLESMKEIQDMLDKYKDKLEKLLKSKKLKKTILEFRADCISATREEGIELDEIINDSRLYYILVDISDIYFYTVITLSLMKEKKKKVIMAESSARIAYKERKNKISFGNNFDLRLP